MRVRRVDRDSNRDSGPGWRRRRPNAKPSTTRLLEALKDRQLDNLDRCEAVWREQQDPMALAAALTMVDAPEWLLDALLCVVSDRDGGTLRRGWARRARQMERRARAEAFASALEVGKDIGVTWELAGAVADSKVRASFDDVAQVTPAAVKKAFQSLLKEVERDTAGYHLSPLGFERRLLSAIDREIGRAQEMGKSRRK